MGILVIIILYIIVILLAIFLFNFKWCIKTIRDIASPKNQGGYTKLVQVYFVFILTIIFLIIVFYYIYSNEKVDKIDVILTVVVGWLGLIIGGFFGEKSMENLHEKQELGIKRAWTLIDRYKRYKDDLLEIIDDMIRKSKKE